MTEEAQSVIRATRGPILKEYEDGSLAVRIVIAPADKQTFMKLLPDVNLPIFIAGETLQSAQRGLQEDAIQTFGDYARELMLHSDWMGNPKVWAQIGTDDDYLEWCRDQKCAWCHKAPRSEAAHVRRVANGAGTGIKPSYSAIPLCTEDHARQHQHGETAIGGKDAVDKLRLEHVKRWAWETMREIFDVESMREANPADVLAWAKDRGVERHLPLIYREAA